MAAPTIPNGEEYFFPVIYEGNGGGQRVGKFVPFTDNGTIANSCIFNSADSAYLTRTPSSSGSGTTFTVSLWFKIGKLGHSGDLFSNSPSGSAANIFYITHYSDNTILVHGFNSGGSFTLNLQTTRTFEDTSKWYHLLCAVDTTQSTSTDRVKLYIDGSQITAFSSTTYPGSSDNFGTNQSGVPQLFGRYNFDGTRYHDGYIAEANMVDGTALTPSTFGLTDTSTGRWIPKTLSGITYGTNGFRLQFGDSSALGDDTSGNTNDFTVANLASTDQTTDSPTQNHATFDPNFSGSIGLSEGNLVATQTLSNNWETAFMGMPVRSGKYYFEFTANSVPSFFLMGLANLDGLASTKNNHVGAVSGGVGLQLHSGNLDYIYANGGATQQSYTTSLSNGDVIGVAYDTSTGSYFVAVNNTWTNSGNPANGTNPVFSGYTPNQLVYLGISYYHNGAKFTLNTGQKSFTYTPPTGFVALQQDNLPETAKGISGLVWTKNRDSTDSNQLYDSSRGKQLVIASNATTAETTVTDGLQKFLAGGQQIEDSNAINTSGESFVSWNWVANGGTTETNTDGSITSTVQVNTTAGFSIVEWTGDGGQSTVGHGLSGTPKVVIQKRLNTTSDWWFYTTALDGSYDYNKINSTNSFASQSAGSAPTNTTFTSHGWGSSDNMVAYVFHEVEGYSKISSYTGNGVADGPFVYTGFRPAFIMFKANRAANWYVHDSTRSTFNPVEKTLYWSLSNAEGTGVNGGVDFLSNGFKVRQPTGYGYNNSGVLNLYMAFAEHPFVGNGTSPVTAK